MHCIYVVNSLSYSQNKNICSHLFAFGVIVVMKELMKVREYPIGRNAAYALLKKEEGFLVLLSPDLTNQEKESLIEVLKRKIEQIGGGNDC